MGLTIDLSELGAERLRDAIRAAFQDAPSALRGRLPSIDRLRQGAEATLADREPDASVYFQSMLELGYLVASADGFAEEERHALAELLEAVTGSAVDHDTLELHFRDLDDAVEALGRRERLLRVAADFEESASRSEALGFAALVALADGRLAEPEANVLEEMGAHFGLSETEVAQTVERVVSDLQSRLSA
jgi:tellurite resistance protein